jgi:integrase
MRGHIRKRGNTWAVVIDVGRDENGRRHQQWRGGFRTKREAEQALTRLLRALQTGEYVAPSSQTLGDFLEREWLPAICATVRPTTFRSYKMHVASHILPRLGRTRLQKLSGSALNAFYAELTTSGGVARKGGLSPATVRRVHAVLHRALRDAVRWERLSRNPADQADPPRQRSMVTSAMTTWTAEQAERFLDSVAGDRLYALWVFMLTTGVRRGEALGLRWTDLDLDLGRAAISQTRVAVGYDVVVSDPKTSRSRRTVALDPGTVEVLRAHRKAQLEDRLMFGANWQETGLIFVNSNGEALHPDRVSKLFDRAVAQSDLPRIRLHDLRHTHATLALHAGVHPKIVSDRLGHSSTVVTLDTYSHVVPGLAEAAAATVASLFLRPRSSDETSLGAEGG